MSDTETIVVRLASGWRTVDTAELSPGLLEPVEEAMRYVAAAVPATPSYAPNLVVTCKRLASRDDPQAVLAASGRELADGIAGIRIIDDFPILDDHEPRSVRTGAYVLSGTTLTVFQIVWLDRAVSGRGLWAASFTCTTREFGSHLRHFRMMSESMEVRI